MKRTNSPDTYTPGPWVFAYGSVYQGDADTLQDDTAIRIALMDRNEDRTWPTERDNNARLIAAAPDLLAACQAIVHIGQTEAYDTQARDQMLAHARAAIAKATNTQPAASNAVNHP